MTILLGIGGAMVANWAGEAFGVYRTGEPVGFIAAVLGSMAILAVYQMFLSKK
ncbi:MAG: GlsB/YeaQ/YmgE family stress response membrane protein [Bdellovibrionota bacterium]